MDASNRTSGLDGTDAAPVDAAITASGTEVGYDAPGYAVNFVLVGLIAALHATWFVVVRRRARAQLDHTGQVPQEGHTQKGYRGDTAGACIRTLSILYALWMQASLVITIASNYSGSWPYSPGVSGEINSRVTWDSFTRAFLLPWIGTFCVLSVVRAYRDVLTTFYMSPCALADASHVRIVCVMPDESGNPVTSQGVVRVLVNDDGLQYVEWQLLRLVYCPTREAFTASPEAHGDETPQSVTGQWAESMVQAGGLTAAVAEKLMRGAQGTNEISIEVPNVLQGCMSEFFNMFYIYQLFAITISFYWVQSHPTPILERERAFRFLERFDLQRFDSASYPAQCSRMHRLAGLCVCGPYVCHAGSHLRIHQGLHRAAAAPQAPGHGCYQRECECRVRLCV
jgi:hypothetical protein